MDVKTGKQREDDFRADFKDLLEKHGAEFELTDDGRSYGMQSPIVRITMMGIWDADGKHLADFSEFDL